jgi:hypothetical protein
MRIDTGDDVWVNTGDHMRINAWNDMRIDTGDDVWVNTGDHMWVYARDGEGCHT